MRLHFQMLKRLFTRHYHNFWANKPHFFCHQETIDAQIEQMELENLKRCQACPSWCSRASVLRKSFRDTLIKFASSETIVEMMYKHVISTARESCSGMFPIGVSFAGGYVAGIFNNANGATIGDAWLTSDFSSILGTIHKVG